MAETLPHYVLGSLAQAAPARTVCPGSDMRCAGAGFALSNSEDSAVSGQSHYRWYLAEPCITKYSVHCLTLQAQRLAKTVAHGVVGVSPVWRAGLRGFLSAGTAQAFALAINSIGAGNTGASVRRTIAAAVAGGGGNTAIPRKRKSGVFVQLPLSEPGSTPEKGQKSALNCG